MTLLSLTHLLNRALFLYRYISLYTNVYVWESGAKTKMLINFCFPLFLLCVWSMCAHMCVWGGVCMGAYACEDQR